MAQLSKNGLLVQNNQSFPNNSTGYITPEKLRDYNVDVIDSTVNQTIYTSASAAWDNSISALNTFTGSQQPSFTALNTFTASQLTINSGVNAFTQSANASINSLTAEVDQLQIFSASINEIRDDGVLQGYSTRFYFSGLVSASIVPNVGGAIASINIEQDGTKLNTSSFDAYKTTINAYTASTDIRLNNLETFSSSAKISISALNAFTASAGPIATGSLVTTSSFSGTTITFTKGNGTTYTNVGIQDTASFNSYTASVNTTTASLNTSVSNLNTFSASAKIQLSNLESTSASVNVSVTNLNASSASQQVSINALNTFSASALVSISNINSTTASLNTSVTNINLATASLQSQLTTIGGQTGSFITESETGSFARVNTNNSFTGSQTLSGSLIITGSAYGNVSAITVVSSTASIDFSLANFFTLAIPTATTTRVVATNIRPGQTVSLLLTQPATTGSLTFDTSFDFPSGFAYSASAVSNAKDIVTFITFDSTIAYGASVKNLL
jgi:hypothetical protein